MEEALKQSPPSGIRIDLSAVDSIDAGGLGSLSQHCFASTPSRSTGT
jgi:anti-anti-sigma regulatory factor